MDQQESADTFDYKDEESLLKFISKLGIGLNPQLELSAVQGDIWIWHVIIPGGKDYTLKLYLAKGDSLERETSIWSELQESPQLYPKIIALGKEQKISYILFEWLGEDSISVLLEHPDSIIASLFKELGFGTIKEIFNTSPSPCWNLRVDTVEKKSYLLKIFPTRLNPALEDYLPSLNEKITLEHPILHAGIVIGFIYLIFEWPADSKREELIESLDKLAAVDISPSSPFVNNGNKKGVAVILLSDDSSNFGMIRELLEIDGEPLIVHAIRVLHTCCEAVMVIGESDNSPAMAVAKNAGAEIVVPPHELRNMITPIEYVFEVAAKKYFHTEGLLVTSLIVPLTDPETPKILLESPKSAETLIAFPTYQGMRGDPIWISPYILNFFKKENLHEKANKMMRQIIRLLGSQGLGVLKTVPGMVHAVGFIKVNNPEVAVGLHSPAHLQKWLEYRQRQKKVR